MSNAHILETLTFKMFRNGSGSLSKSMKAYKDVLQPNCNAPRVLSDLRGGTSWPSNIVMDNFKKAAPHAALAL